MRQLLSHIAEENSLLYKALATRLAAYEGAPIEKPSSLYAETLWHMLLEGVYSAHPGNDKLENRAHFLYLKEGNSTLPEKMAEALKGNVHFNSPLIRVKKTRDNHFALTFQKGEKIQGDLLVMAIPCPLYDTIVFWRKRDPFRKT